MNSISIQSHRWLLSLVLSGCMVSGYAANAADAAAMPETEMISSTNIRQLTDTMLQKLSPSLVRVNYFVKLNEQGKMPPLGGYRCPNCNRVHSVDAEQFLKDRRPLDAPGFLVADNLLLSPDLSINPSNIESIAVEYNGTSVAGKIIAYLPEREGVLIELAEKLAGTEPLTFHPKKEGEALFSFFVAKEDGMTVAALEPFADKRFLKIVDSGRLYRGTRPNTLTVNEKGEVISLSLSDMLPVDANEFTSPLTWAKVSAEEQEKKILDFEQALAGKVYPVRIDLFPNKAQENAGGRMGFGREEDNENKTEYHAPALLLKDGNLLVLQFLSVQAIGRFKSVTVYVDGKPQETEFIGSLKDYGAFLVHPKEKLPGTGIAFYQGNLAELLRQGVFAVSISVADTQLNNFVAIEKVAEFQPSWKTYSVPVLKDANLAFTENGELVSLTMQRLQARSRYGSFDESQIPASAVEELLLAGENGLDSSRVPLSVEEQNRIAWLGVDCQVLDEELARSNNVAHLTDNGKSGLLVSFVYPDSPAAAAGIKDGDILLRITPTDGEAPIELGGYEYQGYEYFDFPWDELSQIPEQYYDQIPTPWHPINDKLSKELTNLGFHSKFKLTLLENGKIKNIDMTVTPAPVFYEIAERYAHAPGGLTVADLTFDVRNYFRMDANAPGVIIANIKPGGKASVGGLKPYEIITAVNDQPVNNLATFKKLVAGEKELRLEVKRMTESRIVKLSVEPQVGPLAE